MKGSPPKRRSVLTIWSWTVDVLDEWITTVRPLVLILVLGLRNGEVLGLCWDNVDLDAANLTVSQQLQRVGRQLLHRETKTEGSDAELPLPGICTTALTLRRAVQHHDRAAAGDAWQNSRGLVFTTRYGTPIEPRNFNRSWDHRCTKAGVRKITVHDGRRSCGTLLADLDVHPRIAMQILRHAQFYLTMEIYTLAWPPATVPRSSASVTASTARRSCTQQLYNGKKPRPRISDRASDQGGRYWDQISTQS
jgi:integrase